MSRGRRYRPRRRTIFRESTPLQRLLLAAAGVLMVAAVALTINYLVQGRATRRVQEELRAQREAVATDAPVVEATETPTAEPAPVAAAVAQADPPPPSATPYPLPSASTAMLPEFLSFFRRNNDMAGWLKSDAFSDVDYPVVKRDNSYYVYRDFYGRDNMAGTVFIDADNSILPQDQNLILHGHNMKNGTMFGKLARLLDGQMLKTQPVFTFDTLYQDARYVPYALTVFSVDPRHPLYFDAIKANFDGEEAMGSYVNWLRAHSALHFPTQVYAGDRLLTLVTCHGADDDERLALALRAVRPGEDAEALLKEFASGIVKP